MTFVSSYTSVKHNVQVGEWEGADEPTVVMEFYSNEPVNDLRNLTEALTDTLTQEAIAFRFNGEGELVFNGNYTGERYPFDEQYFLTIK
jgi:hypothetical protein